MGHTKGKGGTPISWLKCVARDDSLRAGSKRRDVRGG